MIEDTTTDHQRPATGPSALSTAALLRAISEIKEQYKSDLRGEVKVLEARLAAIDKATEVFSENLNRVPTDTQKAVGNLQDLMIEKLSGVQGQLAGMQNLKDEQFRAIQQQFTERDTRMAREAAANKEALDAALESAKEAVGKNEVSQTKAIEQQGSQSRTMTEANNVQITDLKERVTRIEAIGIGQANQKADTQQNHGLTIAVIGLGITILLALLAMFSFMQRMPAAP